MESFTPVSALVGGALIGLGAALLLLLNGRATGPYVLKEFEPGVRAFATRNPNYWKSVWGANQPVMPSRRLARAREVRFCDGINAGVLELRPSGDVLFKPASEHAASFEYRRQ